MNAVRVQMTGELHLKQLPCRRGDKVEAIVLILEPSSRPAPEELEREKTRAIAKADAGSLAQEARRACCHRGDINNP
jgi:hypothetical protein